MENILFRFNNIAGRMIESPTEILEEAERWAHFSRDEECLDCLVPYGIDETVAQSLMEETTRPRFAKLSDNSFMLFLRAINLNPNSEPEDMVSLRMFFDGTQLLTIRNRRVQAIQHVADLVKVDPELWCSTKDIFLEIINQIFIRIECHVRSLADKIDEFEDKYDLDQTVSQTEVNELRRATSRLWRHLYPQLETMKKLTHFDFGWFDANFKHMLNEHADTMDYFIEELTLIRERSDILNNELTGQLNNKVNRNLYMISIITAIFIPLSFITGLLGINVGGIPGAEENSAFWMVAGGMFVLVVIQAVIFKFLRWF